jgi:hypothetical protein
MNQKQSAGDKIELLLSQGYKFRYSIFIAFIAIVYSFLILKAITLSHAQPSVIAVQKQSTSTTGPQINPSIVIKINQLQNNSVNVNALFNQARQNPFQE